MEGGGYIGALCIGMERFFFLLPFPLGAFPPLQARSIFKTHTEIPHIRPIYTVLTIFRGWCISARACSYNYPPDSKGRGSASRPGSSGCRTRIHSKRVPGTKTSTLAESGAPDINLPSRDRYPVRSTDRFVGPSISDHDNLGVRTKYLLCTIKSLLVHCSP